MHISFLIQERWRQTTATGMYFHMYAFVHIRTVYAIIVCFQTEIHIAGVEIELISKRRGVSSV